LFGTGVVKKENSISKTREDLNDVMNEVWDFMSDVSDEIGELGIGEGYILKYEGWGGFCVEGVWAGVENKQKKSGIPINSESAKAERENACYEYAADQTHIIIEDEWIPEMEKRGFSFIDGGYDEGGLYGRTWALFKKRGNKIA
jgi:hypothetical protein